MSVMSVGAPSSTPIKPPRCKHGLIAASCATCLPPVRHQRVPVKRDDGPGKVSLCDAPRAGLLVLHTNKGRASCPLAGVDKTITFAHFDGPPFLWAIEGLIKHAPGLKTIQVIPTYYVKMRSALDLCREHGIQVVKGHYRPEMAWQEQRIVNPQYDAQRRFLRSLSEGQRAEFADLLALGVEAAEITSRYFCLNDEEYVPQRVLADEYGYSSGANHTISSVVLAVLHYLDDTTIVGEGSLRRSRALRIRVPRLRHYIQSAEMRMRLPGELGIDRLADNFPLIRIEVLRSVLAAQRNGSLRSLHPRQYEALTRRFGLDVGASVYRTLEDVGQSMGGITRERVRQLEVLALAALGASED